VRAFADTLDGRLIYKSLDDPFVWQRDDRASFLYTNALTPADLSELDDRLLHPGLFQEQLKAVAELRVTVVGQRVFAARTTAIEGIDWRRGLDSGVPFTRVTLDPVLEAAVVRTVAALGLSFAAVDLLETVDNTYFLEANSCGAWSWLEKGLGLPVTSALVDLLATS
jgi:glutathione synthase/RimK-type ligase-like ATP-grasp enzyme